MILSYSSYKSLSVILSSHKSQFYFHFLYSSKIVPPTLVSCSTHQGRMNPIIIQYFIYYLVLVSGAYFRQRIPTDYSKNTIFYDYILWYVGMTGIKCKILDIFRDKAGAKGTHFTSSPNSRAYKP